MLLEVAATARGPLRDFPRAARVYAKLREDEPADREILGTAARDLPHLGRYRGRGHAHCRHACRSSSRSEERTSLRLEQAELLLARPDTEQQAADLLQDVLEDDPTT